MFERLKKVFSQSGPSAGDVPKARAAPEAIAQWAQAHGLACTGSAQGFLLEGQAGGKPWKLEVGRSTRDFIKGQELRARGEVMVNEDAAVLVMNRPLKDALEKRAYQMYTDTLQTTADPSLPEEMRWLAMYPEVGWDSLPPAFWKRYSVMADHRSHGMAWLDTRLANLLLAWPDAGPDGPVPFILMMLRGKAYLRMQYEPADLVTLEHATLVLTAACESALAGLSQDITL